MTVDVAADDVAADVVAADDVAADRALSWPRDLVVRRLLTWYVVRARRIVTVDELVRWLGDAGFGVPGRASKVVSDKLRADVARGRLRRVGRGRYVAGHVPPTTWRRIESSAWSAIDAARAPRPGT